MMILTREKVFKYYFRAEIYDENFAAVELNPSKVKMSRPRYLGMIILNLAKHIM